MSRYNSLAQAGGLLKGEDNKVAASQVNFDFAINFDDNDPDDHGQPQNPCTHCGACMTGCNVGAKRTAVETYLKLAVEAGVEVFTKTEVRHFVRDRSGFSLDVYLHNGDSVDWTAKPKLTMISCDMLVIGAGALGSSEIMLRSRLAWKKHRKSTDFTALAKLGLNTEAMNESQKAPARLPTTIGKQMGRNGNAIFAIWAGKERSDVVGHGLKQTQLDYQVGPAVTSALDTTEPLAPFRDGMLIFDLAIPPATVEALNLALPKGKEGGSGGLLSSLVGGLFGSTTGWKASDPLNHSLVCFITGHDNQDGVLVFDDKNQPVFRWQRLEDQESYKRIWSVAETMAKNLDGSVVTKPGEMEFGQRPLTFHLLGGCTMSNNRSKGVVNDYGAVFDASQDSDPAAIIPRLFITGSATIPTSVGNDPALLIAGLSERSAEKIAKKLATGELGIVAQAKR